VFENIAAVPREADGGRIQRHLDEAGRGIHRRADGADDQAPGKIDAANAWDIDAKIEMAMEALRCPPGDADVTNLSGGEIRRAAICALLLSKPDMILMDEPTNHLDAESVAWLQNYTLQLPRLRDPRHPRPLLPRPDHHLDPRARSRQGIPTRATIPVWLEKKAKRIAQESREEAGRQKSMARELEWVRSSAKARQAKSKARMNAYEEKAPQAEREKITTAQIRIPPGPRLGSIVIEAEHLNKAFGDKLLIEDLSFKLPPGGIVGVIGPTARARPRCSR
jgi:ATPase subunit of ABC transporter with duplicated ATPase domains